MPQPDTTGRAAPTRPDPARRSDRARAAVMASAWELFVVDGLRQLTVEGIAAHSGVAKTTIYRWWPSKTAVVLDALREHLDTTIGFPDTGDARDDLRRQLRAVITLFNTPAGRAYLALIAEGQHDAALAREIAERYIAGRRAAAREVIERGIAADQLRDDLDPDTVVDLLYGPVYYRLLVSHDPPEPGYADALIELACTGLDPHPTEHRVRPHQHPEHETSTDKMV